jgi:hypothetical protein
MMINCAVEFSSSITLHGGHGHIHFKLMSIIVMSKQIHVLHCGRCDLWWKLDMKTSYL